MANVVLKIQTNENYYENISFTFSQQINNVSSIIGTATTDNDGVAGLSFSKNYLKFQDGYLANYDNSVGLAQMENSYNGFMFDATDNNGDYILDMSIDGTHLDKIVVVGDKNANQFPTIAILDEGSVNEKTIYNDDLNWAIAFDKEKSSHTIKFTTWNRVNYNACFTTLKVMLEYLELNRAYIDEVDSLSQSTSDPSRINYGVLANSGSAQIRDLNGEIKDYITDDIIPNSNVPVELWVNGKKVQSHITTDSDYDKNSSLFSIQMTNKLDKYKNIIIKDYIQSGYTGAYKSFYETILDILDMNVFNSHSESETFLENITTEKIKIDNYGIVPSEEITIKSYLKRIVVNDGSFYVESSSLYDFFDKICKATQLNLIEKDNGEIKFVSARPKKFSTDKIFKLIPTQYISTPQRDIILKNKYDNIEYDYKNVYSSFDSSLSRTIYFKDENDEYSLKNLDRGSILYNANHLAFLNFFIEVSSANVIIPNTYFLRDGSVAYNIILNRNSNPMSIDGGSNYFWADNKDKDDYDFQNALGRIATELTKLSTLHSLTFAISLDATMYDELNLNELNNIYIDLRPRVVLNNKTKTLFNNNANKYKFDYDNELIGSNVKFYTNEELTDSEIFYNIMFNHIVNDYNVGLNTAKVSIFCTDLYNINDVKQKTWENGEIFEIGDIIRIDKDKNGNSLWTYANGDAMLWKVTGRNFKMKGSPTIDLELQEIKQ